jgi:predicted FMN-binding regulatory protein PaiB
MLLLSCPLPSRISDDSNDAPHLAGRKHAGHLHINECVTLVNGRKGQGSTVAKTVRCSWYWSKAHRNVPAWKYGQLTMPSI